MRIKFFDGADGYFGYEVGDTKKTWCSTLGQAVVSANAAAVRALVNGGCSFATARAAAVRCVDEALAAYRAEQDAPPIVKHVRAGGFAYDPESHTTYTKDTLWGAPSIHFLRLVPLAKVEL